MLEPGRFEYGYETSAGAHGGFDDGCVVSVDLDWQLYRRKDHSIVSREHTRSAHTRICDLRRDYSAGGPGSGIVDAID